MKRNIRKKIKAMKTKLLFIISTTFVLISCSKNYICECVTSKNGTNSSHYDFTVRGTFSQAKKYCEDQSVPMDASGNKMACDLK